MKMPVESYDVYRSLIAGKRLNNNSYFDSEIKRYIAQGRLSFIDAGDVLFLFFSEVVYEQLVIYAEESLPSEVHIHRQAMDIQGELPWVCNVVFRSEEDASALLLSAYLEKLGFNDEYINEEFALADPEPKAPEQLLFNNGLELKCATEESIDAIESLWKSSLPMFVLSSFDRAEMEALIAKKRTFIVTDESGALCGAFCYDAALGKTTIHHLAVAPAYRGQGLGGLMIDVWLSKVQGAKLALAWIERNNLASSNLFQKRGFRRTNKRSHQYVRRREQSVDATPQNEVVSIGV